MHVSPRQAHDGLRAAAHVAGLTAMPARHEAARTRRCHRRRRHPCRTSSHVERLDGRRSSPPQAAEASERAATTMSNARDTARLDVISCRATEGRIARRPHRRREQDADERDDDDRDEHLVHAEAARAADDDPTEPLTATNISASTMPFTARLAAMRMPEERTAASQAAPPCARSASRRRRTSWRRRRSCGRRCGRRPPPR